jgi:hypothetical protein
MSHVLQSPFSPSRAVISAAACSERAAAKLLFVLQLQPMQTFQPLSMASSHLICLMSHALQSPFSPSLAVISAAACSERAAAKLHSVPDWGAVDYDVRISCNSVYS